MPYMMNHPDFGQVMVADDGTMYVQDDELGNVAVGNAFTGQTNSSYTNTGTSYDGPSRYYDEANERWVSMDDQEASIMEGITNKVRQAGYIPYSGWTGDQLNWADYGGAGGNKFNSEMDYLNWLYGPGGSVETLYENNEPVQYFKTPHGADAYMPGATPLTYAPKSSTLGDLIPMIIGGMALGPLSAGLTSTFGALAPAIAGGLIGGTTAEIGGGDFLKGALTGGIGAGLTSGLSGVSSSLVDAGMSPTIADAVTKAAATAVKVGVSGGDVEQAILGSLVNSGVGGLVSEGIAGADIPQNLVKTISNIATPVISTAIQGGDVETALTNSLIKGGLSLAKDASWGVNEQPSQDIGDMIGSATPFDMDDAEIGAGIDLTGGTGLQYADASNVGGTRIDVAGSPFYQGMEGSETIQAPEGMRLATYDEANQGDIEATTLPDGQMAFVVPDTQQEVPTDQQKEPVVSEEQLDFTDQLAGVQQSFQTQFDQLSDAQKDQALALLSQGQSLESAISSVQTGLANQLTGVQESFQSQFDQLSDAQKDQALALLNQGQSLEQAISGVQTGLTEQIGDVRTGLTNQITGLESNFQSQFDKLSDAQKDQALALLNQGQSLDQAISDVQTGLTGQISNVQTQLQQDIQSRFDQLTDAQKDQAFALNAQGIAFGDALNAVESGLTGQISGVQSGLQEQISGVQTGLQEQISGVQQNIQSQFDQFSEAQKDQVLALMGQGETLENSINQVSQQFQTQIQDLQSVIEGYRQQGFDQNTATQLAMDDLGNRMDLSAQEMKDISDQFQTGIQGVYEQLGIATSDLQAAIDSLSYNQKIELDQRMLEGQRLDDAISDIQQGIDTRFTQTEQAVSGLGSKVSGIGSQVADVQKALQSQAEAQANANLNQAFRNIQNIFSSPEPIYPSPVKPFLSPSFIGGGKYEAQQVPEYSKIIGELASVLGKRGYKVGGEVRSEDNPVELVFGPEDRYYARHMKRGFAVNGPGTGQSDDIPTMLADGEYVFDADTVAALGDGSSKAGAEVLDKFRENIRAHKRSAPTDRIPPKAKNPLAYLKAAQKAKG